MHERKNEEKERGGKIARYFCDGLTLKQIAKLTGNSYISIYKMAKKYERNGLIVQISKYPLIFSGSKDFTPPLKGVGDFTPPLLLPHKFGASFLMFGRPKLIYDRLGKAGIKESSHSIQFGRTKATIWLNSFRGTKPREIVTNAEADIKALAQHYAQKYGVKLSLSRVFAGVEWTLNDKPASSEMADKCEIMPTREIADALFKFDDSSHPDYIEINQAPQKPPEKPSQHAETLHYLLTAAPNLLRQLAETAAAQGDALTAATVKIGLLEDEIAVLSGRKRQF